MAQLERVAVRGGLSLMECNEREDRYCRERENTATPEEAASLLKSRCRALTGMIAECRKSAPSRANAVRMSKTMPCQERVTI